MSLRPRAGALLKILLEAAPSHVSRQDLHAQLWEEHTDVEVDGALNALVRELRSALSGSGELEEFIATLSKRGYRFSGRLENKPAKAQLVIATVAIALLTLVAVASLQPGVTVSPPKNEPVRIAVLPPIKLLPAGEGMLDIGQIVDSVAISLREIGSDRLVVIGVESLPLFGSDSVLQTEDLDADYLLRTTVSRNSDGNLEINASLKDARTGFVRTRFHREYSPALNRRYTTTSADVVSWVARELGLGDSATRPPLVAGQASTVVDALIQARWHRDAGTRESGLEAIRLYDEILEGQAENVEAISGKILSLIRLAVTEQYPAKECYEEIERLALALFERGNTANGVADIGLSFVRLYRDWDIGNAKQHAQAAILADPQSSEAHTMYSFVRAASGDLDGAIRSAEVVLRLQPVRMVGTELCFYLLQSKQFDRAIRFCAWAHSKYPELVYPGIGVAIAFYGLGDETAAVDQLASLILAYDPMAFEKSGVPQSWQELGCSRAKHYSNFVDNLEAGEEHQLNSTLAHYWAQCGVKDKFLFWTERALHAKEVQAVYFSNDILFSDWAEDPDFLSVIDPVIFEPETSHSLRYVPQGN